MTVEEKKEMYSHLESGSKKLLEKVVAYMSEHDKLTWREMLDIADIMKDVSEIEKNVAKVASYGDVAPVSAL